MSDDVVDASARQRGQWSPARREAQENRAGTGARVMIPLVLPRQGQIGRVELPARLTNEEWDVLRGQFEVFRYGLVSEEDAP